MELNSCYHTVDRTGVGELLGTVREDFRKLKILEA